MKRVDKVVPVYSRSEIDKAGDILRDEKQEKEWAFKVLNNWRASHSYPINTFQAYLRSKIRENKFKKTIVVQRIKRVPSIIGKLNRIQTMKLSRMHDIGGLRAILKTQKQIYTLVNSFRKARFRHELVKTYDYIEEPKNSGYRGIHLVYKYNNRQAPEFNNLRIEVQLRTFLQHAWATAVETMGIFLDHSLKASEGPKEWLEFFSMVGSAFAYLEDSSPAKKYSNTDPRDLVKKIIEVEKKLSVKNSLLAFGSSIEVITSQKIKLKYYIIHLKPAENKIIFQGYHAKDFEKATNDYLSTEKSLGDQRDEQVVLVSGDSFIALKNAYPNYFLDTHEFNSYLDTLERKFSPVRRYERKATG